MQLNGSIASLSEFLRTFHAGLLSDTTLSESEIPVELPSPLAQLYRELGALVAYRVDGKGPFCGQDMLFPVDRLRWVEGMVEFACECQENWRCRSPAGLADPPVFSDSAVYWEQPQVGFVQVCDSLRHFLTTLCLQEAVMGAPQLWEIKESRVQNSFNVSPTPLWLDGVYVYGGPSHQFYTLRENDALVLEDGNVWLGSYSNVADELVRSGVELQPISA